MLDEYETTRLLGLVAAIAEKLGIPDCSDPEIEELKNDVDPEKVWKKLKRATRPQPETSGRLSEMGITWMMTRLPLDGSEPSENDEYSPEPQNPMEMNALFVGDYEGPLKALAEDCRERSGNSPGYDDYSIYVMSAEAVKRLNAVLQGLGPYQPIEIMQPLFFNPDATLEDYADLKEEADRLRAFVASVAADGCEMKVLMC